MSRMIAFYLPQYHPIPENDVWWGKGFTEWTNCAKARPLFPGHYQPHVPADLGFYDLRLPEAREAQAELARTYGVEAFCYYHYWFGGRRLLERPLHEVITSGKPDFPFCICWANQTWTGIWHGAPDRILMEQTYPGDADYRTHFTALLQAFTDRRYLTVDGKPLFLVYRPKELPDAVAFTDLWRELAHAVGLRGLHLVGVSEDPAWRPGEFGFDGSIIPRLPRTRRWVSRKSPLRWLVNRYRGLKGWPLVCSYEHDLPDPFVHPDPTVESYPCIIPNWDNTPRSGSNGLVLHGSTPELFRGHVRKALELTRGRSHERDMIFIKAWNEWAEGNHMEPDLRFGHGYLEVLKEEEARERAVRAGVSLTPSPAGWTPWPVRP